MATTADYLNKLVSQKNTLADNLVTKGVKATHDETFETLVPKVLDISGGGVSVVIGDRIKENTTSSKYKILSNGSAYANSSSKILKYQVFPTSVIYIKALDDTNECKYIFQSESNVTTSVPNTKLVADPVTSTTDGIVIVPDSASYLCFSVNNDDTETGVYSIISIE